MIVLEVIGTALAVLGAGLVALSAIGLHRFDDPMTRLHVASKASSTGILVCLLGAGIASGRWAIGAELLLTGAFLVLSIPLATHVLASAHHARRHRLRLTAESTGPRPAHEELR